MILGMDALVVAREREDQERQSVIGLAGGWGG
jgi:hypothetical protein